MAKITDSNAEVKNIVATSTAGIQWQKKTKVDERWFKALGWEVNVYNSHDADTYRSEVTEERHVVCTKYEGKRFARFDHKIANTYWKNKNGEKDELKRRSSWYSFFCSGNGFTVENRISRKKFTQEQIFSALKVCGYETL